ncbi:MAG: ABC transporter permease, partial [Roseovarius indicus]
MQALTRHISPGWLLVAPFFLVVVAFYLGPLANILWLSVTDPEPGLGNYEELVTSDAMARILWTTFRTCAITTVFSVAIGYCLAYAMVHAHQKNQNIMLTLLLISFWISVLVRTFAWLMLLGHNGLVNNGMEAIGLIDRPVRFMRNELGVLIGMVHYMVPYAVLPLMATMQTLDSRVMAASRNLGANGVQTFRWIYLPLTIPGLVASS